ncbi:hypothetical protein CJD36_012390 [Flavipsychrobacter stenotrophus]|uniref:Outer membrane protein beta-barrel domain-containing protein n=1 Tax=Flavipsychrobacter stenotrophus TaxID=2077091 RepID=A0A2S7SV47_9BACT|nr:hypothetical protein [Flavipsychrobacter stenotrophus]PQJ10763.1 hypothetical protein CJD36_012390 [Flavipsychrobacter stenotrophus]
MLNKITITAALCAITVSASAQMTSYTKTSDDPHNYKPTAAYIDLFNADTYLDASISYGVKVETVILKHLMPWVQYRHSYLDIATHHVVSGYPTKEGGLRKQMVLDLGGAFFLADKEKKKPLRVVLSSFSGGGYTHTRYMMVPGTMRRMFGVEGGVFYNRKALEFDDDSHSMYSYKTPTGQEVPIEGVGTSSSNPQPAGESYKPLSMTNVVSIYGGLRLRKVTSLFINVGGRTKNNAKVSDLYADIMLAPVVPIADVVDINGAKWGIEAKSGSIRHLGWRVGYSARGVKTLGFQYNFEFGQRPGPMLSKSFMANGTFISMGFGVSIAYKKLL